MKLGTELKTSKFIEFAHLVVTVDNEPLDMWLAARTSDAQYEGLVTTLEDCMVDVGARPVAWKRILPPIGGSAIAPILICEADLDFSCIVVVVEVVRPDRNRVRWTRFGRDRSEPRWDEAGLVGTTVDWFEGVEALTFSTDEYLGFLESCKRLKSEWWLAIG